jgi:hypothetical protein
MIVAHAVRLSSFDQTCWLRQHAPAHESWDGVAKLDLSWAWVGAKRMRWNVRCRVVHDPRVTSMEWGCCPGVRKASPLATIVCCKAAQDRLQSSTRQKRSLASRNVLASPTCTTTASRSATCRGRGRRRRRSECSGVCDVVWCTIHGGRAGFGGRGTGGAASLRPPATQLNRFAVERHTPTISKSASATRELSWAWVDVTRCSRGAGNRSAQPLRNSSSRAASDARCLALRAFRITSISGGGSGGSGASITK